MKVLVFGGTGMLGSMIVKHLALQGHEVTFTTRERLPCWFPMKQKIGVLKYDAEKPVPDLHGYDFVINCIGSIKQKNTSPYTMYATNAVFPWKLQAACQRANTRLIHISSDCVFSGKATESYRPDSVMDAEDDYGRSKALGEPVGAIVVRTSIIGPAEEKYGLFEWFLSKQACDGYLNHTWSGVTTLFLAQFLEGLMTKPPMKIPESGGLIQIASDPVTKCELLEIIRDVFSTGCQITPTDAPETINRVLVPSVSLAPNISTQLVALKNWMNTNG